MLTDYCVRLDDNRTPRVLWQILAKNGTVACVKNDETHETAILKLSEIWIIL
jgi:hypothetical protein